MILITAAYNSAAKGGTGAEGVSNSRSGFESGRVYVSSHLGQRAYHRGARVVPYRANVLQHQTLSRYHEVSLPREWRDLALVEVAHFHVKKSSLTLPHFEGASMEKIPAAIAHAEHLRRAIQEHRKLLEETQELLTGLQDCHNRLRQAIATITKETLSGSSKRVRI